VLVSELELHGYPSTETAKLAAGATIVNPSSPEDLAQIPLGAPSVFNFFLPDFSPSGAVALAGLAAPELQIVTEATLYDIINMHYSLLLTSGKSGYDLDALASVSSGSDDTFTPDYTTLQALVDAEIAAVDEAASIELMVDWLDLYLDAAEFSVRYAGAATPNPRSALVEALTEISAGNRVKNAAYLISVSPQSLVQR
jgi:hypothetical protein